MAKSKIYKSDINKSRIESVINRANYITEQFNNIKLFDSDVQILYNRLKRLGITLESKSTVNTVDGYTQRRIYKYTYKNKDGIVYNVKNSYFIVIKYLFGEKANKYLFYFS